MVFLVILTLSSVSILSMACQSKVVSEGLECLEEQLDSLLLTRYWDMN